MIPNGNLLQAVDRAMHWTLIRALSFNSLEGPSWGALQGVQRSGIGALKAAMETLPQPPNIRGHEAP